jgi:tetratricopeptide (TPR) repeat protein
MSEDYVPSFRRAARLKASQLGISEDELNRRMEIRRRASDAYPRPDCFEPDELEMIALRPGGTLPEDRLRHLEDCAVCAALVEASTPKAGGLEALLDEVRQLNRESVPAAEEEPVQQGGWIAEPASVPALVPTAGRRLPVAAKRARLQLAVAMVLPLAAVALYLWPRGMVVRSIPFDHLAPHIFGTTESIFPARGALSVVLASYETEQPQKTWLSSARYLARATCHPIGPSWLGWGTARVELLKKGRNLVSSDHVFWECDRLSELSLRFLAAVSARGENAPQSSVSSDDLDSVERSEPMSAVPYVEGINELYRFEPRAAQNLLAEATKADPANPFAFLALSEAWSGLGYDNEAAAEAQRAAQVAKVTPTLTAEQRSLFEARAFATASDWDGAARIYEDLRARFPGEVVYSLKLAEAQLGAGQPGKALTTLEELQAASPQAKEDPRAALLEADAAGRVSNYRKKREEAARAAALATTAGVPLLVARAQVLEAEADFHLENGDRPALELYRRATATFTSLGYRGGMADALIDQARILGDKYGETEKARDLLLDALKTYQAIGNLRRVALVHVRLGHTEADDGRIAEAREHYQQALADYETMKDQAGKAQALTSIGILDLEGGQLERAEANLKEAGRICQQVQNQSCRATALHNLAGIYVARIELDVAYKTLDEALKLRQRIEEPGAEARSSCAMGEILLLKGDLAAAKKSFDKALVIQEQRGAKLDAGLTRLGLAKLRRAEGAPGQAIVLAHQALDTFQQTGRALQAAQALNLLAEAYLDTGQETQARAASEQAQALLEKVDASESSTLEVQETRLSLAVAQARVDAASGKTAKGRATLDRALAEWSGRSSPTELEARLVLGQLETQDGLPTGQVHLKSVREKARDRGLRLLAERAARALAGTNAARAQTGGRREDTPVAVRP